MTTGAPDGLPDAVIPNGRADLVADLALPLPVNRHLRDPRRAARGPRRLPEVDRPHARPAPRPTRREGGGGGRLAQDVGVLTGPARSQAGTAGRRRTWRS